MADYGIKVSKPGFDVTTAALYELAFTSALVSERVAVEGTTTLTSDGSGTGSTTITHSLGSPRQFLVFSSLNGFIMPAISGASTSDSLYARINSDNLRLVADGATPDITRTVYYKIFYDTI